MAPDETPPSGPDERPQPWQQQALSWVKSLTDPARFDSQGQHQPAEPRTPVDPARVAMWAHAVGQVARAVAWTVVAVMALVVGISLLQALHG